MSAYDQASILINRCKRILALVDTYVDCPTQDHRTTLRKALLAEFDAAAIAPPVAAEVETISQARANFEDWYTGHAADIKAAPIGSRDSMLQWSSWIAARSGNYVARSDWKISPGPWGPAGAPAPVSIEAQLARRGAALSPEIRQTTADARAAGQSIAATPGGLVFMNDGAEPGSSELDCPARDGSGHAGEVAAGSEP